MFWRMTGLSNSSPVDAILDKDNFTLEELLDEDEIIQECKAVNGRLINYLRERTQVEKLVCYIVEEPPQDADRTRTFKFPFIASEIFTCEVDIILRALVEDEELMNLLFSFLDMGRCHSNLMAGYFSKVVICLMMRKTVPLMNYIHAHRESIQKMVDLIGITSIMEVLIRLIGVDEHLYTNYADVMQWLEDTDVLEMIVDKFSSSDCPEVHANAAEALCAITRYAPPAMTSKISSPSFIRRLFRHALEDSRPKSVLVNSLSVCISLLDPKRLTPAAYFLYSRQMTHGSGFTANPDTVEAMLESLADLLMLLNISSGDHVLQTTYGKLQPPFGKHRLKIVEFISVLATVGSEASETELIRLNAIKQIIELFFEYPYNNFLHHHAAQIIMSCLESKNHQFADHLLRDCGLVEKILEAEKNFTLAADQNKPTIPAEGKSSPRIGNIGHITRIANKVVQLANSNNDMQAFLQENIGWTEWHANVLSKRNAVENVLQWACGRPTSLQDCTRDSDDDDYQDRDYDVAALANNLSQAVHYGIYSSNDDIDEAHGAVETDDGDVYFDDESAEVVISSLRLGDDKESGSLFTNSNWFAFEGNSGGNERSIDSLASPSPEFEATCDSNKGGSGRTILSDDEDLEDTATSEVPDINPRSNDTPFHDSSGGEETETQECGKQPEWVEWRENSNLVQSTADDVPTTLDPSSSPNSDVQAELSVSSPDITIASPSTTDGSIDKNISQQGGESQDLMDVDTPAISQSPEQGHGIPKSNTDDSVQKANNNVQRNW